MLRCGPKVAKSVANKVPNEAMAPSRTRYGRTTGTDQTDLTSGTAGKGIDRQGGTRTDADAQGLSPDRH